MGYILSLSLALPPFVSISEHPFKLYSTEYPTLPSSCFIFSIITLSAYLSCQLFGVNFQVELHECFIA